MRYVSPLGTLGILVLTGSLGLAQAPAGAGKQAEPPMTNIQVFKNQSRAQVVQTMYAFNSSLGVECSYCHVTEGPGGRNDFASDEKPTKKVARQMILLRDSINTILPAVVGKTTSETTRVLCRSCHRGLPVPKAIADVVTDAAKGGGAAAGMAKYRELRAQFYGGQAYDFTEDALLTIAQRATARPDDAIAYLQANLEYFPKSARTYQQLAQMKSAKGDKDGAIKALENAVNLDPKDVEARAQLQEMKSR